MQNGRLEYLRAEIERLRYQLHRQRKEIKQLEKAGINTLPAQALLARMTVKIESLCAERDKLRQEVGYPKRGVA
jgi:hypothetical protein